MKRCWIILPVAAIALGILSLIPTWNFSERLGLPHTDNPLWDTNLKPISSGLTQELQDEGLKFQTGRGAEADPDGICFGDFGSDEYWVVQYDPKSDEVDAYAWIIDINWIGHVAAARRFSRIHNILRDQLNNKKPNKAEMATPRKPSD